MEERVASKTEFTECWRRTTESPYIMRLALSAGIGGLLFGYDTGNHCECGCCWSCNWCAFGGWMNDKLGRKGTILVADVVFFIGALVMAIAPAPWVIILGRVFVGLGVGMASMTAPLYISEASPAKIRGALVSINAFLITGGQFLSYLINLAFTKAPGSWRWMLGVAGVPAVIQFVSMLSLPESPRWLYRQNKEEEAKYILSKIYRPSEVEDEMRAMQESIETEREEEGITVQVAQQFVGINTVMYYSPTIVQFAGIDSNSTALALSLVTSGLNAVGSILSKVFIDRYGRRKLMLISMIGIIVCLIMLSVTFNQAAHHAPAISNQDTLSFGANSTCRAYTKAPNFSSWNCMHCLQVDCAFCASSKSDVSVTKDLSLLLI
ncbi:hypothetical protein JHK87_041993 [Glycine soja]|nr:hypothetical protein JHK87_041993 [Glycine soja]